MSTSFPLRCWLEVDLTRIEENVTAIRRGLPPGTSYISVVKADGYGVGATKIVEPIKMAGAAIVAVASIAEAAEIRRSDGEIPILLLSAILPGEYDYVFEYGLTPTISHPEEALLYGSAALDSNRRLSVHLKFDTGMGRLGIWHARANELIEAVAGLQSLEVCGVYSHFARSDTDADFTAIQRERLLGVVESLPPGMKPGLIHIDNSAGLVGLPPGGPFNAVRVGLLQLGVLPDAQSPLASFGILPALSLHARVALVKDLPKGTGVSYGSTHKLERDSRVAVLSAGYADGILRACSNRGQVLVGGRRRPILGIATMDEIIIDVTDGPEVRSGDLATFFGGQGTEEISINEYSYWCQTIPWESLCVLSKRVVRVYR